MVTIRNASVTITVADREPQPVAGTPVEEVVRGLLADIGLDVDRVQVAREDLTRPYPGHRAWLAHVVGLRPASRPAAAESRS